MYSFWQTILLEKHTYFGSPFPPHAAMALTNVHFDAWLKLWYSTVQEFLKERKLMKLFIEEIKWQLCFYLKSLILII
ncbi:hypothetical protein L950_0205620 [Sphingobacterium sp. IITKGP-BTPF85]|nr:hypothetical protein L950_0205620 [Sphingobacterium sp. IITKGP-BTPF85]